MAEAPLALKALAASGAAVASAFIVNPFDVVKVSQSHTAVGMSLSCRSSMRAAPSGTDTPGRPAYADKDTAGGRPGEDSHELYTVLFRKGPPRDVNATEMRE